VGHVEAHTADLICKGDQNDLVLPLDDLNAELNVQCERSWFRPALVMGIGNGSAAKLLFRAPLHDFCGLRPQNWIRVITNRIEHQGPGRRMELGDDWTWSRRWRFKQQEIVTPRTR
jgi:hypothetical protein